MHEDTILTLRDIARQLDLPESTVRYYRDAYSAYIPVVGQGRRRRYPPEAVDVLRDIAQRYANGNTREAIEHALGAGPFRQVPSAAVTPRATTTDHESPELTSAWVEGERERQQVMWQMVQEIVRLGDAVERQQVILGSIVEHLARATAQALPQAQANSPATKQDLGEAIASRAGEVDVSQDLRALRDELARERELVERLRRGKLELERRAAAAEMLLEEREPGALGGSIFGRFRSRPGRE